MKVKEAKADCRLMGHVEDKLPDGGRDATWRFPAAPFSVPAGA